MNDARPTAGVLSLGVPIDDALATLGRTPVDAIAVGGWRSGRVTYRVTLSDGQVVKVRQLRSRTRVARAAALVAAAGDPRLPRALVVLGGVTIEAWVDGTVLASRRPTASEMDAAADLLADLHALTRVEGHAFRRYQSTAAARARAERQVADLAAAGLLTRREGSQLVRRVASGLPARAARGVIHGDLRPENLVVTPSGTLVSIDNEAVHLDFLASDLGRTWCRWPMSTSSWTRFRRRYAEGPRPGIEPAEEVAWCITAAVKGAHRWSRARRPNTKAPLRALARAVDEFVASG